MLTVAKVAVENAAYSFDKAFDYLVPQEFEGRVFPGSRILVPFGAGSRTRQGMVFEVLSLAEDGANRKKMMAVLDEAPLLSNESLSMAVWMKERYFCTLFEAAKLLLPSGIGIKIKNQYCLERTLSEYSQDSVSGQEWQVLKMISCAKAPVPEEKLCTTLGLEAPFLQQMAARGLILKSSGAFRQVGDATKRMVRLNGEPPAKLTAKQRAVVAVLQDTGTASLKELCYFTGVTPVVVSGLEKKGIVQVYELEVYRNPYESAEEIPARDEIVLSAEQQKAFSGLLEQYRLGSGGVSLLYGITGSGKTSVFMRLIDEVFDEGRGVIVMVPEISLTPQTISLFHRRFGRAVAVFHSGLSLGERLDEWKRVRAGEARIAVGTRSAVFAPLDNLGLIIMDEEQEYTYKSEASPRYHARDVAKFRCAWHKAPLVLASATPSVESFYLAQTGRYSFYELPQRYGPAILPEVTVADMNLELERGNATLYSEPLLRGLEENLEKGRQSIILLNRRGYNTFVSCKSCGYVVSCPNCSISLTYHAANDRLLCHYCGYSIPFINTCPQCQEERVYYAGFGTQRAEQQLSELLPGARILRLDTDAAMTRFDYEKKLKLFSQGEYDIIVGTQMVAKGLDFENVTLVGVLSADQALYSDDFRSYERAFSLLTQVVGRAGRGNLLGRAVIQTFTPENPVLMLAARQDYRGFYENELSLRQGMLYPPFADICVVGFVGADRQKVQCASLRFLELFAAVAKSTYAQLPLRVLDPAPAGVPKLNNKYRYKLIVKCRNSKKFREMMANLLLQFTKVKEFSGVTAFADVNPDMIL